MTYRLNRKSTLGLITIITTLTLTGCGSSSKESQLTWLKLWDAQYESKVKMIGVCYQQAGIASSTKQISTIQNEIVNECELTYITEVAEKDGISMDRELIKNNIIQLKF